MKLFFALIPAVALAIFVCKMDRVEREPASLIWKTVGFGVISCLPTVIVETILDLVFRIALPPESIFYILISNFLGVALIEEFFKMLFTKLSIWNKDDFNYKFDAIVYCVAGSLGFAAFENILYVFQGGVATAFARAFTSIPGHAIFGLTCGYFFGFAKEAELEGKTGKKVLFLILSVLMPTITHGIYDAALSFHHILWVVFFYLFLFAIEIWAVITIIVQSKKDRLLPGMDEDPRGFNSVDPLSEEETYLRSGIRTVTVIPDEDTVIDAAPISRDFWESNI